LRIKLEDSLYNDSIKDVPTLNQIQITEIYGKIDSLKQLIVETEFQQDSLYTLYTEDYLRYKRVNIADFDKYKSKAMYKVLYGEDNSNFSLLNNTGLVFGENTGSVYSEIVNGELSVFRLSLGQ